MAKTDDIQITRDGDFIFGADVARVAVENCHWTQTEVAEHFALRTRDVARVFKQHNVKWRKEQKRRAILNRPNATPEEIAAELGYDINCVYAAQVLPSFTLKPGELLANAKHFAAEHPDATAQEISDAVKCSVALAAKAKKDPQALSTTPSAPKPRKRVAHSLIAAFAVDNYHLTQAEIAEHFDISVQPVVTAYKRGNVAQRRAALVHGVRNYLHAHPDATDLDLAERFGCSSEAAKRLRTNDGRYAPKTENARAQIEAFITKHPNVLNSEIADAVGCAISTVHNVMRDLKPKSRSKRRATTKPKSRSPRSEYAARRLQELDQKQPQPLSP